ncbi:trigger factor [Metamycoplasma buccale]|uniref:trigger factor n=1 Tax=Metamycoplasma buccale TaxID=55602 RepID=UPI00398E4131
MSKLIDKKNSILKISYTINGKDWEEAKEKAKIELRKNVQIKGFRKGHVPPREADKYLSKFEILDKALHNSIEKIYDEKILSQVEPSDEVIGSPSLNITELLEDKATIEVSFPIHPEVKLGDYKKMGLKLGKLTPTKEDLEEVKKSLISNYVVMLETEGPVKLGDSVNFNFIGYIDGKTFEGGDAEDYDLVIGSNQFIPGFETQMIGMKTNESKNIKLRFPDDYHAVNLAGKDVVFDVKINFIKTANYPEINEQFLKEINLPLVKTNDDFEKLVKIEASRKILNNREQEFINEAKHKLLALTEFEIAPSLVEEEAKKYYQNFLDNLKHQDITEKEYIEFTKNTKEKIMQTFKDAATKNLKELIAFAAVAKSEKFTVTEADYLKEVDKLANLYGLPVDQVKNFVKFDNIQMNLTNKFITNLLMKENDPEGFKQFSTKLSEIEKYDNEKTESLMAMDKEKKETSKVTTAPVEENK